MYEKPDVQISCSRLSKSGADGKNMSQWVECEKRISINVGSGREVPEVGVTRCCDCKLLVGGVSSEGGWSVKRRVCVTRSWV